MLPCCVVLLGVPGHSTGESPFPVLAHIKPLLLPLKKGVRDWDFNVKGL